MESFDLYAYIILPFLIFLARIIDVSIGTLRIMFVSKGTRKIAPLLGFFEVLVWILAISEIMQNLNNWICYVAYAAGFATGNYIGMLIEEKLAMGVLIVRIITQKLADNLIYNLKEQGFGVTMVDAKGTNEDVHIIYTIIQRHELRKVVSIIKEFNPKAFYSVEDVRFVNEGVFPLKKVAKMHHNPFNRLTRKAK
jgi:uncharacterized protein YebE (UPF0316 family)